MEMVLTADPDKFEAASPAARAGIVSEICNYRAAELYQQYRHSPEWKPQRPREISALRNAVLFIMIKDEDDIIGQNLEHHYALGFRRYFILDNASVDETASIIRKFREDHSDASIFYAYDYVVGYHQALKMKALDQFMQSYLHYDENKPSWLFFVDADEFLTLTNDNDDQTIKPINDLLNDETKNLLVFHWVQCASDTALLNLPNEYDIFSAFPITWPRMKAEVSKIAYRVGKGFVPIQGNHAVEKFPFDLSTVAVMAEFNFFMFHFPNRSVEQLRRKLLNANKALVATTKRDGLGDTAGHWRTYYQWYIQSGDQALIHILNDHIKGCLEP
jgi:hypothetical protein